MIILYIEDSDEVREAKTEGLRSYGFDVIEASGPSDALHQIEQHHAKIDVILLDIMMPHEDIVERERVKNGLMTGYILLEKLNSKAGRIIPVIVFTAYSNRDDLKLIEANPQIKGVMERGSDGFEKLIKKLGELDKLKMTKS